MHFASWTVHSPVVKHAGEIKDATHLLKAHRHTTRTGAVFLQLYEGTQGMDSITRDAVVMSESKSMPNSWPKCMAELMRGNAR